MRFPHLERAPVQGLVTLLPFVLIFVVMYFLMVRPQQKRAQEQRRLVSSLEPGDEVVTIGGVFGDIVEVEDAEVILELYDGTQVKFLRSAIARKVVPEDAVDAIDELDDDLDDVDDHDDVDVTDDDVEVDATASSGSPEGNGEATSMSKAKSNAKSEEVDD